MFGFIESIHLFSAAATGAKCDEPSFFGLPVWYHYLNQAGLMTQSQSGCDFVQYGNGGGPFAVKDLSLIGLGIVDILLRLAAMVAIGYLIYGGFTFMTSQGSPDGIKRAQSTIFNALIGLGIAIAAIGAVAFIASQFGA
jgi:uncharacterized membrane protein (DUF373 family)